MSGIAIASARPGEARLPRIRMVRDPFQVRARPLMDSPALFVPPGVALEFPVGELHRHRLPGAPIRVNHYCG
jgi:hypothetical protein